MQELKVDGFCPYVRSVRRNTSPAAVFSYIDPEYVFTYIRSGEGIFVVEEVEYHVAGGDMLLMSPYMLHVVQSFPGKALEQCVLHFDLFYQSARCGVVPNDPEMNYSRFCAKRNNPETRLVGAPLLHKSVPEAMQGRVYRLYERLAESFKHPSPNRLLHERAAMLEIIALYLDLPPGEHHDSPRRAANWRNIERALSYIHAHYNESVMLEQVSAEARLSTTYLCALFKEHTGMSIHRYITQQRLYKAKCLISDTELSLGRIAELTGLGDIHSFSKCFKQHEKMTPSQYRRCVREMITPQIP